MGKHVSAFAHRPINSSSVEMTIFSLTSSAYFSKNMINITNRLAYLSLSNQVLPNFTLFNLNIAPSCHPAAVTQLPRPAPIVAWFQRGRFRPRPSRSEPDRSPGKGSQHRVSHGLTD